MSNSRVSRREFVHRSSVAAAMLGVPWLAACTSNGGRTSGNSGADGQLVINSFGGAWGDGLQLGFIDGFQEETGIEVTLLSTWDLAASQAAVESGNEPPEDMLDNALPFASPLIRDGLLAKIDYGIFDEDVLTAIPESLRTDHTMDYGGFGMVVAFDGDEFPDDGEQPETWNDFWDSGVFPGSRGMMDWSIEPQPEFALLADGVSMEELYPLDMDRVFAKMDEIRDAVPRFYDSSTLLTQAIVDRQVTMETGYTHRLKKLADAGLDYVRQSLEGARFSTQTFTVWENAPNRENAMRFIEYIMKPDVQARWAQIADATPVNPEAADSMTETAREVRDAVDEGVAWTIDWNWYSETNDDGKTNLETLTGRWVEWLEQG